MCLAEAGFYTWWRNVISWMTNSDNDANNTCIRYLVTQPTEGLSLNSNICISSRIPKVVFHASRIPNVELYANRMPKILVHASRIPNVLFYGVNGLVLTHYVCNRSPLFDTTFSHITPVWHYFLTYHSCLALRSHRLPLSSTTFSQITPVWHYVLTDFPCLALLSHISHLLETTFSQITSVWHYFHTDHPSLTLHVDNSPLFWHYFLTSYSCQTLLSQSMYSLFHTYYVNKHNWCYNEHSNIQWHHHTYLGDIEAWDQH